MSGGLYPPLILSLSKDLSLHDTSITCSQMVSRGASARRVLAMRLPWPPITLAFGLALLALFPLFSPSPFWISLVSEIFVLAIWALSLDLLLGYSGLVSFGHAAYF